MICCKNRCSAKTHGFFRHLLKNDLSVMNFISSDFTILNERLAKHYGIPGVKGNDQFQLVKIPRITFAAVS